MRRPAFLPANLISYLLLLLTIAGLYLLLPEQSHHAHTIQLAVAGPLSGRDQTKGQIMADSARLALEHYQSRRTASEPDIRLRLADDKNQPHTARTLAQQLADSNDIAAVIGHRSSTTSKEAIPIYSEAQLPVISGTASADYLSRDNAIFFRTTTNNSYQAWFITQYIARILRHKQISIIYEDDDYGISFSEGFYQAANEQKLIIEGSWRLSQHPDEMQDDLDKLIDQIIANPPSGAIFLALRDRSASKVIVRLRDAGIRAPLIGGMSIGKQSFARTLRAYASDDHARQNTISFPTEQDYTKKLYVASGLIFDSAGANAQHFRQAFLERFGYLPDAAAAAYYDATNILIQGLRHAPSSAIATTDKTRRYLIQYLKQIGAEKPYKGITSEAFFFNTLGDAVRPLTIGLFRDNKLVSAPVQLQLNHTAINQKATLSERPLIYTGIKIHDLSDIDAESFDHGMEFTLWFRSEQGLTPEDLDFLNAVQPIEILARTHQTLTDGTLYQSYRIRGRFQGNYLKSDVRYTQLKGYGQHLLGLHFQFKDQKRLQPVFVADSEWMEIDRKPAIEGLFSHDAVMNDPHWRIQQALVYQDRAQDLNQAFLTHAAESGSRFNLVIRIQESRFHFFQLIPEDIVKPVIGLSLLFSLLPHILRHRNLLHLPLKLLWLSQVTSVCILMISTEAAARYWLDPVMDDYQMSMLAGFFSSLWWISLAILIITGVRFLIWIPLEERTGRKPPRIIQAMLISIACGIALFGIIAFVFGHELGSLLATSGLLAMIIGFAIQMNIANFFSGIAINIETPFRVGDYIRIGNHQGMVTDITWRSTRLKTKSGEVISIPNAQGAESTVINYSLNQNHYRVPVIINTDPKHAPETVIQLLEQAVRQETRINPRLVEVDKPDISYQGVAAKGARYQIYVTTISFMPDDPAIDAIYERIWTLFNQAGIAQLTHHNRISYT